MCRLPRSTTARGIISAQTGPADITYEWVINGTPIGIYDHAGSQSTGPWSWDVINLSLQNGNLGTSGSVALKVLNDGTVSPAIHYGSECVNADHDFFMIALLPDMPTTCEGTVIRNNATITTKNYTGTVRYQWFKRVSGGDWQPSGTSSVATFTGVEREQRIAPHKWTAAQSETGEWKLTMTYGDQTYETAPVRYQLTCPA
ncbi:hypothetical protein [Herbidospora galbida]|uniref:hypothetical protein n=1 Tax=Herbidospora galbida TaxID=2575442 RepID=UPI001484E739|nr:hypothetical protein [Herbidospora galbida]